MNQLIKRLATFFAPDLFSVLLKILSPIDLELVTVQ